MPWGGREHYCSWRCLRCDPSSGNVTELRLSSSRLAGSLPAPIFAELPSLVTINLSANAVAGPLPITLWRLAQLKALDLTGNRLRGERSPRSPPTPPARWQLLLPHRHRRRHLLLHLHHHLHHLLILHLLPRHLLLLRHRAQASSPLPTSPS